MGGRGACRAAARREARPPVARRARAPVFASRRIQPPVIPDIVRHVGEPRGDGSVSDRYSSKRRFEHFRAHEWRPGFVSPDEDLQGQPPLRHDRAKRRGYVREFAAFLRPFYRAFAGTIALGLAAAVLSLVLPRATMYIVDVVLPHGDWRVLHLLGAGLLLVIIVHQSFDLARWWYLAKLNARIVFRLRRRLYDHLLRLPLHKLYNLKTGGITSRLSGDIDSVSGLPHLAVVSPAISAAKVLLTLAILLWINWQMSIAALLLTPLLVALNLGYMRRIRPIYRSMRRDRSDIDGRVVETFGGIRVVRAFGREKTEARRYAIDHHAVIRKGLLAEWLEVLIGSGWGFLIPLTALTIVWLGGTLVLLGETTVGGIIAFQMYLMMLLTPLSNIIRTYGETQRGLAALERVFDLLREPIDLPDRPGAREAAQAVETFEFENVSFAYRPDQPVLRSFSLRVEGGMTVALVGPSGAGKTTVTNLVARFYDPDAGVIRLNGVDLRDIQLRSYRRLLGLVQQDVFLFDGTVAENIAYARPDATRAQIEDAARRANAHEFIVGFPDGYDTIVGERGVRLSGGQAQRISIARALLADPRILILDEATSNLDSESEQLIQASLRELLANRTTFVIAHRLSTVVNADLIVVMEAGRIVELGTHELLLAAANGRYREMVLRQQRALELGAPAPESPAWLT